MFTLAMLRALPRLTAALVGALLLALLTACGGSTAATFVTTDAAIATTSATRSSAPAKNSPTRVDGHPVCALRTLPREVGPIMDLIKRGGPFKHKGKDGSTFHNRERRLPSKPRGYYREYTVPTPGERTRGARRIVTGGKKATSPDRWYYTGDHYSTFCVITGA